MLSKNNQVNEDVLDGIITGLFDLAQRPWIRRAWVVQEVLAARSISVHCGNLVLPWREFCLSSKILLVMYSLTETTVSKGQYTSEVGTARGPNSILKASLQRRIEIGHVEQLQPFADGCSFLADTGPKPDTWDPEGPVERRLVEFLEADSLSARASPTMYLLHGLLGSTMYLRASDDRDRVYALSGIAAHLSKLLAEYSKYITRSGG